MTKYKSVLFDLDGTLADTSLGITNCHRYTLQQMGKSLPSDKVLYEVIGAPLMETYRTRFGFDSVNAKIAVDIYRKHYEEIGIYQASLYDGMEDILGRLSQRGYIMGVATLKKEEFAVQILKQLGIAQYFDTIKGMDGLDHLTKKDIIIRCLNELNVSKNQVILVGDSHFDSMGAMEAGIDFIGVTYGFGFKSKQEVYGSNAAYAIDRPEELDDFLGSN